MYFSIFVCFFFQAKSDHRESYCFPLSLRETYTRAGTRVEEMSSRVSPTSSYYQQKQLQQYMYFPKLVKNVQKVLISERYHRPRWNHYKDFQNIIATHMYRARDRVSQSKTMRVYWDKSLDVKGLCAFRWEYITLWLEYLFDLFPVHFISLLQFYVLLSAGNSPLKVLKWIHNSYWWLRGEIRFIYRGFQSFANHK